MPCTQLWNFSSVIFEAKKTNKTKSNFFYEHSYDSYSTTTTCQSEKIDTEQTEKSVVTKKSKSMENWKRVNCFANKIKKIWWKCIYTHSSSCFKAPSTVRPVNNWNDLIFNVNETRHSTDIWYIAEKKVLKTSKNSPQRLKMLQKFAEKSKVMLRVKIPPKKRRIIPPIKETCYKIKTKTSQWASWISLLDRMIKSCRFALIWENWYEKPTKKVICINKT